MAKALPILRVPLSITSKDQLPLLAEQIKAAELYLSDLRLQCFLWNFARSLEEHSEIAEFTLASKDIHDKPAESDHDLFVIKSHLSAHKPHVRFKDENDDLFSSGSPIQLDCDRVVTRSLEPIDRLSEEQLMQRGMCIFQLSISISIYFSKEEAPLHRLTSFDSPVSFSLPDPQTSTLKERHAFLMKTLSPQFIYSKSLLSALPKELESLREPILEELSVHLPRLGVFKNNRFLKNRALRDIDSHLDLLKLQSYLFELTDFLMTHPCIDSFDIKIDSSIISSSTLLLVQNLRVSSPSLNISDSHHLDSSNLEPSALQAHQASDQNLRMEHLDLLHGFFEKFPSESYQIKRFDGFIYQRAEEASFDKILLSLMRFVLDDKEFSAWEASVLKSHTLTHSKTLELQGESQKNDLRRTSGQARRPRL